MTDLESDRSRVLAFAAQIGSAETQPEDTARDRGWIGADGAVTDDGRALLRSLGDQAGTRSVFR